jgi:hypothetical protein
MKRLVLLACTIITEGIYGKTPLQIATQENHYAVIKALTASR